MIGQSNYPLFVYKGVAGYSAYLPDFPAAPSAMGQNMGEVRAEARRILGDEVARLKGLSLYVPTPTDLRTLVSVRGGTVELLMVDSEGCQR